MADAREMGFESEEVRFFPKYIMYDVINVCNARCIHCPQSMIASAEGYEAKSLSWRHFDKTIREVAKQNVDLVRFTGDGEPLMHPDMARMIALSKDLGVKTVNLTTNGSLLQGKKLRALLENPPDVFDISLDAFYPETFAKVRVGLNFEKVKANVMGVLEKRDPKRSRVVLSIIHQPGMDDEVAEFEAYWKPLVDYVAVRGLHTNLGLSGEIKVNQLERWPCQHLWGRLVIDFRGHIRYCPVDWLDQTSLGSVDDLSLYDAWHGAYLERLRSSHLKGDYKDTGACRDCMDWSTSPWDSGWLSMVRNLHSPKGMVV